MSAFNSPLLLGFDHFERALDQIAKKSGDGYPPYNVAQIAEDRLQIILAVAGFRPEDLSIELDSNQLVIRGRRPDEPEGRTYLHRGIAARAFQRAFVLADGIEVAEATLDNGLLTIDLVRPRSDGQVRRIPIGTGKTSAVKKSARKIDLESR